MPSLPSSTDRMKGPFSDPKAVKALRVVAISMLIPIIVLASIQGTLSPYRMRWAGVVANAVSAVGCLYLLRAKRNPSLKIAIDLFAFLTLLSMVILQCILMESEAFLRTRYSRRYWWDKRHRVVPILCYFALFPQLISLSIHAYFLIPEKFWELLSKLPELVRKKEHVCPHCNKHFHQPIWATSGGHYEHLDPDAEIYHDNEDDARRSAFAEPPAGRGKNFEQNSPVLTV